MIAKPFDIYIDKNTIQDNNILEYWASNVYARVNNLLRNYPLDTLYKETPYLFLFLNEFLKIMEYI